jgi:hypothetical protein
MLCTGWQTCFPFESLRYLEVYYFLHGLLKIPAASVLQELVLGFETCEKELCDMPLNFSQLPQLTTLRIHNLEGGLTLTGKPRSVTHLELTYSSIDGNEIFGRLSSKSREHPHSGIFDAWCPRTGIVVPSPPISGDGKKSGLPAVGPVQFYGLSEISYCSP